MLKTLYEGLFEAQRHAGRDGDRCRNTIAAVTSRARAAFESSGLVFTVRNSQVEPFGTYFCLRREYVLHSAAESLFFYQQWPFDRLDHIASASTAATKRALVDLLLIPTDEECDTMGGGACASVPVRDVTADEEAAIQTRGRQMTEAGNPPQNLLWLRDTVVRDCRADPSKLQLLLEARDRFAALDADRLKAEERKRAEIEARRAVNERSARAAQGLVDVPPSSSPEPAPGPCKPDQEPAPRLACALCACSLDSEPGRGRKVGSVTLKTRGTLEDGRVVCAVCYFLESPKGRRLAAQCGFSERELRDQRDAHREGRAVASRPCFLCDGKITRDNYWVLLSRAVQSDLMPASAAIPHEKVSAAPGLYRCTINDNGARSILGGMLGIKPSECVDVCGPCAEPEWFQREDFDKSPGLYLDILQRRFPVGSPVRHRSAAELGVGVAEEREPEDRETCPGFPLVKWPSGGGGFYHPRALINVRDEKSTVPTAIHLLPLDFVDVGRGVLHGRCGEPESGIGEEPVHHMTTKLASVTCQKCRTLAGGASPSAPAETVTPFVEAAPVTPGTPTGDARPHDVTTGATAGASLPESALGIMTGAGDPSAQEARSALPAPTDRACTHGKCDGSGKLASGEICLCARGVAPMAKTPAPVREPALTWEDVTSRLGDSSTVSRLSEDLLGGPEDRSFPEILVLLATAVGKHGREVAYAAWARAGGTFTTKKGCRSPKTNFTPRRRARRFVRELPPLPPVESGRDRQAGVS